MSGPLAIRINGVSKKYKLFESPQHRLWEALHPFKKKYHEDFWALKDITFDVERGDTLGIIGRNGSGKSTLLQVISGILTPTVGTVQTIGRIAALLELGADFNPEFTGRENVLMKGMLMGYSAEEMARKLPEIEAFAEIGPFIEQPVRVYSSGMFVRLAFATAIHVDPDIMIVDEALAVGDARFQHKCYQRFREFQEQGRTILFVTHDMHAITRLCKNALLLDHGRVLKSGEASEVIHHYHELVLTGGIESAPRSAQSGAVAQGSDLESFWKSPGGRFEGHKSYHRNEHRFGDRRGEILDYRVVCGSESDVVAVKSGSTVEIHLKARFQRPVADPLYGVAIKSIDGVYVYGVHSRVRDRSVRPAQADDIVVCKFTMPLNLAPGDYFLDLGLADKSGDRDAPIDIREASVHLIVEPGRPFFGLADLGASLEIFHDKKTVAA